MHNYTSNFRLPFLMTELIGFVRKTSSKTEEGKKKTTESQNPSSAGRDYLSLSSAGREFFLRVRGLSLNLQLSKQLVPTLVILSNNSHS